MFLDTKSTNKCHKIQESSCSEDLVLSEKEILFGTTEDDIEWTCTDGKKAASECTKSCKINRQPDGMADVTICQCSKKCSWKKTPFNCI